MEKKQVHIAYGFVTGIIMVVVYLVLYMTGLSFKPIAKYLPDIPFLVGIVLNAMAYSKANGGSVTFGNVFGSCFKATMIVTIVMVVWVVICVFIFPDMKEKALEVSRQEMAKNPKMTEDMIDKSLEMVRKGYTTIVISFTLFGTLFMGAIFSVIGGAVAKKNVVLPVNTMQG